jgi:hypothetical protein
MNAFDPGRVRLRLQLDGSRIAGVDLASERPKIARALRGRLADEVVRLVPLLYAVCGRAQGSAAELALAAARGELRNPALEPTVAAEAMREHLWRWLLDLPGHLGLEALKAEFAGANSCLADGRRADLSGLLAIPRVGALRAALAARSPDTRVPCRLLPVLDAAASLECWPRLDEALCRQPTWQGGAAETGALARCKAAAGGLAARWQARLDEVSAWCEGSLGVGAAGTASAVPVAPGIGRAAVQTARGLLLHEVVLDGDRVADYFIVAPTEWNFHPEGPLAAWLQGRSAADRETLRREVSLAVASFDPCVGWELEGL